MSPKLILVVEDNEDDLALGLRAIKKCKGDFRVVTARDGAEAVDILGLGPIPNQEPIAPDLILLDLKMPKKSGIEVLESIRANAAFDMTPVVMLTSSDEPSDLEACYGRGANSYTVKPVDYSSFVDQLCTTVDYWTRINRCPPAVLEVSKPSKGTGAA
jgi:two-component system, response regulator